MQQVYQDASSQGSEGLLIERLKVQFENSIIKQLSMKVHNLWAYALLLLKLIHPQLSIEYVASQNVLIC